LSLEWQYSKVESTITAIPRFGEGRILPRVGVLLTQAEALGGPGGRAFLCGHQGSVKRVRFRGPGCIKAAVGDLVKGLLTTRLPAPRERRRATHPRARGADTPTRQWRGPGVASSKTEVARVPAVARAQARGSRILTIQALASVGTLAVGASLVWMTGVEAIAIGWLSASAIAAAVALHGRLSNIRRARPVYVV
jgi:hypothetical protein